jgi:hypothetical protein
MLQNVKYRVEILKDKYSSKNLLKIRKRNHIILDYFRELIRVSFCINDKSP